MTEHLPIKISVLDIVPMDIFLGQESINIDLVYASEQHSENIFSCALYHPKARLCLHRDLARVVLKTARILKHSKNWTLVLKDGLRTIEAQQSMMETEIVRKNPHWLIEPRMLSSPGIGGHPRGMAVDVSVANEDGTLIDMGTLFDTMTPQSSRNYDGFSKEVLENRIILEQAFLTAAKDLNLPLLPLPSEWWDFRFPAAHSNHYLPLSDDDLPDLLQMTRKDGPAYEMDDVALAKSIAMSL